LTLETTHVEFGAIDAYTGLSGDATQDRLIRQEIVEGNGGAIWCQAEGPSDQPIIQTDRRGSIDTAIKGCFASHRFDQPVAFDGRRVFCGQPAEEGVNVFHAMGSNTYVVGRNQYQRCEGERIG
jgi:hypothetical protein